MRTSHPDGNARVLSGDAAEPVRAISDTGSVGDRLDRHYVRDAERRVCRPARGLSVAGLSIGPAWRGCPWVGHKSDQVCGHGGCGDELRDRVHDDQSGFCECGQLGQQCIWSANFLENWENDLQTQFNQAGFQQLWGLITGSFAGLLDGFLILVAYLLYPIVVVIFGFFYIFYGSILYIFGPIVIALMPLGGANRLAKSYVENIFIWNAWPILYGGFGALLSAVQMGQVGQMLNQNNFLGGLGNLEGSFLIGIVSIVYSLAIAVIPFIAKRIVSGDVGSTAVAMVGTAVTATDRGRGRD